MQEDARVIQHHSRLFAFVNELRDEVAHSFVTPMKPRRVVIVADALVVHHVFEVADEGSGPQVAAPSRNQWLVHMKCNGKRATDPMEISYTIGKTGNRARHCFFNAFFGSTDVGLSVD